jgi:hypothetical protein
MFITTYLKVNTKSDSYLNNSINNRQKIMYPAYNY